MKDAIRQAQGGDSEAFETLYRENAGRVYALCFRLSGDRARAEELVQDVFIRVWERLDSFRGESEFSSWLHRVAVNVVMMDARSRSRRERRVQAVEDVGALERGAAPTTGLRLDLEAAITQLPEGARAAFVLHDVEGYRHEEIAAMTGIAVGTSKAQLFRARRLLREALDR